MRGTFTILILFLFGFQKGAAQSVEKFDFLGSITASDSVAYSYRLQLEIQNGIVTGYSITDYLGADETKTKLSGTYNYENNQLLFLENSLVYTKSIYEPDLCYVEGMCVLGAVGKTATLKGTFVGKYLDKKTCASGTINLFSTSYVMKKLKKLDKTASKTKKKSGDTLSEPEPLVQKSTILKSGESITYNWKSNKMDLLLWDQGLQDGDKIKLTINGKLVLYSYELKSTKKVIPVTLNSGENTIVITALNEGSVFPNTVSLSLRSEKVNYELVTSLVAKTSAKVTVIK